VAKGAAERDTYLDVIDAVRRQRGDGHAAAPKRPKHQPPHPRADYARRKELQRDLARYYERCKDQNAGKGGARRTKQKCSAIAWTLARKSGRYPDYFDPHPQDKRSQLTMPRRDPRTGLFMKRGARRARRSRRAHAAAAPATRRRRSSPRRARRAAPRARTHVVYAGAPKVRRRRRRGSPRRGRSTNIAIVPVGARAHGGRRRSYRARRSAREMFAWDAPRAGAGSLVLMAAGVGIGALGANLIHRYAMTYAAGLSPAATPTRDASITTVDAYNQAALGAKPNMWSIGLQLGLAVVGLAGGVFAPWGPVKMFSYGIMAGATGHLFVQLANSYIIEPMMSVGTATVTPTGKRLFAFENIANPAINPPTGATTTAAGLIGAPPPSAVAAAAPANQPKDRVPASLGAPGIATPAGGGGYQRAPVPVFQQGAIPPGYVAQTDNTGKTVLVPVVAGQQPNLPVGTQPGGGGQPQPPPYVPPANGGGAPPPPSFGPPGGGQPAPPPQQPGNGGKQPCAKCGPSCDCVPSSYYGQPPLAAPHPLIAALRAA
jgi:hypothetical protein